MSRGHSGLALRGQGLRVQKSGGKCLVCICRTRGETNILWRPSYFVGEEDCALACQTERSSPSYDRENTCRSLSGEDRNGTDQWELWGGLPQNNGKIDILFVEIRHWQRWDSEGAWCKHMAWWGRWEGFPFTEKNSWTTKGCKSVRRSCWGTQITGWQRKEASNPLHFATKSGILGIKMCAHRGTFRK